MHDDPLRRLVCLGLAPALLLVTALLQVYQVEEENLHPWKGGGFGMFAHAPGQRMLRVMPIGEDRTLYQTPIPSRFRDPSDRLIFRPTEARLREFARELIAEDWRLVGGERGEGMRYPVPAYDTIGHPSDEPVRIVGMRLQVVSYRYAAASHSLEQHLLLEVDERAGEFTK